MSCKNCHWYKEDNNINPCTNIGESGWEHWMDFKTAPTYCSQYCRRDILQNNNTKNVSKKI